MGPSVLVVDDDLQVAELVSSIRGRGYEVRTASDAESAIASVDARPPALILGDLEMPGMADAAPHCCGSWGAGAIESCCIPRERPVRVLSRFRRGNAMASRRATCSFSKDSPIAARHERGDVCHVTPWTFGENCALM